jgi:hypothetical protein
MGQIKVKGNELIAISDAPEKPSLKLTFYIVRWSDRVYLVESRRLIHFCNDVNSGSGRRQSPLWLDYYVRDHDLRHNVCGFPDVPERVKSYLLAAPITVKILKLCRRKKKALVLGYGELVGDMSLVIDKGRRHGVKAGMRFHPRSDNLSGSIYAYSVRDSTSELLVEAIWSPDGEQQPLKKGGQLSTLDPLFVEPIVPRKDPMRKSKPSPQK